MEPNYFGSFQGFELGNTFGNESSSSLASSFSFDEDTSSNYDSSYDSSYDSAYDSNYDSNYDSAPAESPFKDNLKRPAHHDRHPKRFRLDTIPEEDESLPLQNSPQLIQPSGSMEFIHESNWQDFAQQMGGNPTTPIHSIGNYLATPDPFLNPATYKHMEYRTSLERSESPLPANLDDDFSIFATNFLGAPPANQFVPSSMSIRHPPNTSASVMVPGMERNPFRISSDLLGNRDTIFELKTPLRPKQRKSYEQENRYLSPNPVIGIKEIHRDKRITSGIVSVELVDVNGNSLPADRQKLLGSSAQGALHLLLNPHNLSSTRFQLKIYENSRGQSYRLKFHITYLTENKDTVTEYVLSNTFLVESNKKKQKKAKNSLPKEH
eukprot:TRINITY_DN6766_c0_g3_i1.p1 TRINITY_DN6766_c0_g3~~TRINITY_DN6766_c0_g3_i1.p1  ORF type:complete len:380 (+),score=117.63 TRINITY_DN6766_c0_g3_i1:165-1304(+)